MELALFSIVEIGEDSSINNQLIEYELKLGLTK